MTLNSLLSFFNVLRTCQCEWRTLAIELQREYLAFLNSTVRHTISFFQPKNHFSLYFFLLVGTSASWTSAEFDYLIDRPLLLFRFSQSIRWCFHQLRLSTGNVMSVCQIWHNSASLNCNTQPWIKFIFNLESNCCASFIFSSKRSPVTYVEFEM